MVYVPDYPKKKKPSTPKVIDGQLVRGAPKDYKKYTGVGSNYGAPGTPSNPKPKVRDRDTPRPKPGKGGNFSIQPMPKGGNYGIQPVPKTGGSFQIPENNNGNFTIQNKDPETQIRRKKALTKRFKGMSSKYGKREGFEEPEEN